ncbi:MAG: glycosyltransferase family 2 protein [Candidatus Aminicenantes bacterium]|nr:glycosyltransferase family 2 protein [Candidatus Aminicenantes bacterium]
MKTSRSLSIVIPVYNEEENVTILFDEIKKVLEGFVKKYEVIFINDGSTDNSLERLMDLRKKDKSVRIINFRKNFGQSSAISAGFELCTGDYVITMDADLQNDPANIPDILEKLNEGFDIVNGWRKKRKDSLTKKIPSYFGNKLVSFITKVKLHDYGCTLRGFKKDVVKTLKLYGEMHRYIPAIASRIGIRSIEIPVNHRERRFGKSKYGLGRTFRVILDLISIKYLLSFSHRPLQIFGSLGMLMMSTGFLTGLYITYEKYFLGKSADRPLLTFTVLVLFLGFQIITLGLLAEMLTRVYHEGLNKNVYTIRETYGFEDENIDDRT